MTPEWRDIDQWTLDRIKTSLDAGHLTLDDGRWLVEQLMQRTDRTQAIDAVGFMLDSGRGKATVSRKI